MYAKNIIPSAKRSARDENVPTKQADFFFIIMKNLDQINVLIINVEMRRAKKSFGKVGIG